MLTIQNKQLNSIFERIVKDKNGVLVCVKFTVVEINGKFQPQVISITPIVSENKEAVCLPILNTEKVIVEDTVPNFIKKVSPYFSLEFLMSQPTRAPAYYNTTK